MKFVVISDTHGQHRSLKLPKGDVIIHAGDISKSGHPVEIEDFLDWFSKLKFKYKIFIAGNHDFFLEHAHPRVIEQMIPTGVIYLNDSGAEINGIKFWGSPITPWFHNWAFNRERGEEIKKHWELIPDDTDVLITHGPPMGILDENSCSQCVGCMDLLVKVNQVKPKYHFFGHIHEGYGQDTKVETIYLNASVLNDRYQLAHEPMVINFK